MNQIDELFEQQQQRRRTQSRSDHDVMTSDIWAHGFSSAIGRFAILCLAATLIPELHAAGSLPGTKHVKYGAIWSLQCRQYARWRCGGRDAITGKVVNQQAAFFTGADYAWASGVRLLLKHGVLTD